MKPRGDLVRKQVCASDRTAVFVAFDRFGRCDQQIGVVLDGEQGHVLQALGHQCRYGVEERAKLRIVLAGHDASLVSLVEYRLNVTDPSGKTERFTACRSLDELVPFRELFSR